MVQHSPGNLGSLGDRAKELWHDILSTIDDIDDVDLEPELDIARWAWSGKRNADFIMLWVASTARCVDQSLNPLSLQDKWRPRSPADLLTYNGRGLADLLGRWNAGRQLWIGTSSPDPMNTGNYLSKMSLFHVFGIGDAPDLEAAVEDLRYDRDRQFVRLIQRTADFTTQEARRQLTACMLLSRQAWLTRNALEDFAGTARPFYELIRLCETVLRKHSEAGRWGEAFVAACLEAVDARTQTKGAQISRFFAGDTLATLPNGAQLTIEVRQKYEPNGPMNFGAALAEKRGDRRQGKRVIGTNLGSGIYLELPPVSEVRRSQAELRKVREETGTFVLSVSGVFDLLTTLLATSPTDELAFAERLPALFDAQLRRQNVEDLHDWRGMFDL